MPKRMTDTEIWKKQRWFRKLSASHKLAFLYIKDQCDHAGIWNIDCSDLVEDIGLESFVMEDFIKECNTEFDKFSGKITVKERLRLLDKGYLWVTGFIQFQCKGKEGLVNPHAKPVITALQRLNGLNLLQESIDKGFLTLTIPLADLPDNYLTPKERDKDKDIIDRIGGVGGKEEVEKKNKFCTKPLPEHFNGLPENKIPSALEAHTLAFGIGITENDVNRMWNVFKTESLTGENFYNSEEKVYTHFLRWIRKQSLNKPKDFNQPVNQINKIKSGDTDKYRKTKRNV